VRLLVAAWPRLREKLSVLHPRAEAVHQEQVRTPGGGGRQVVLPVVLVNFVQQLRSAVAHSVDQAAELDSALFSEREEQQDHPCLEVEPTVCAVATPDSAMVVSSVVRRQLQVWN